MAGRRADVTCGSLHSRVGLLGPYSSRNLGDTAIQMAVIANLRARRPALEIVGICSDPGDTVRSLGIPAFPLDGRGAVMRPGHLDHFAETARQVARGGARGLMRWRGSRRIARFVRTLDLLIISGGGQLDDYWGGAWNHPFVLFHWTVLARLHGVRVAFVGIGLDRLSTPLSRFFVLGALRLAHYRAFRDAGTLASLESLGLHASSHLCPDLAFSLEADKIAEERASNPDRFIAVNPISESTWTHAGNGRHDAYLRHLAAACEWAAGHGYRIRIVCSQSAMDSPVARRLAQTIDPRYSDRVDLCEASRVPDFLGQVRGAQLVIASRLHGAILSLVTGVPVVAISPMPKVTQLMHDIDLADYCVELQTFSAADLLARVRAALDLRPGLQRRVREKTHAFHARLTETFSDLVTLTELPRSHRAVGNPAD